MSARCATRLARLDILRCDVTINWKFLPYTGWFDIVSFTYLCWICHGHGLISASPKINFKGLDLHGFLFFSNKCFRRETSDATGKPFIWQSMGEYICCRVWTLAWCHGHGCLDVLESVISCLRTCAVPFVSWTNPEVVSIDHSKPPIPLYLPFSTALFSSSFTLVFAFRPLASHASAQCPKKCVVSSHINSLF